MTDHDVAKIAAYIDAMFSGEEGPEPELPIVTGECGVVVDALQRLAIRARRQTELQEVRELVVANNAGAIARLLELNSSKDARARAIEVAAARLQRAKDELEARNRELSEFTYVASHDLQQPLRAIVNFANFIEEDYGELLPEEGLDHLQRIISAGTRMRGLIDSLLRYTRAGTRGKGVGPCSLNEIMNDVRADLAPAIGDAGATLIVSELPDIVGEREQLYQLLSNLVGNALKFGREDGPTIEVFARVDADGTQLRVRDDGVGIDDKFHTKIFKPFKRVWGDEIKPGHGIGLAICQRIMETHGGRIFVESAVGEGACFVLHFPKQERDQGERAA